MTAIKNCSAMGGFVALSLAAAGHGLFVAGMVELGGLCSGYVYAVAAGYCAIAALVGIAADKCPPAPERATLLSSAAVCLAVACVAAGAGDGYAGWAALVGSLPFLVTAAPERPVVRHWSLAKGSGPLFVVAALASAEPWSAAAILVGTVLATVACGKTADWTRTRGEFGRMNEANHEPPEFWAIFNACLLASYRIGLTAAYLWRVRSLAETYWVPATAVLIAAFSMIGSHFTARLDRAGRTRTATWATVTVFLSIVVEGVGHSVYPGEFAYLVPVAMVNAFLVFPALDLPLTDATASMPQCKLILLVERVVSALVLAVVHSVFVELDGHVPHALAAVSLLLFREEVIGPAAAVVSAVEVVPPAGPDEPVDGVFSIASDAEPAGGVESDSDEGDDYTMG